ncbi:MAG: aminopeptidase P N-terminal domain-containing protein, partial [Acidobacteriota bacterium]|nr:aminopeptidase P N-terminal domain-containing protein [Acidobacteriota bacterium]
MKKTKLLSMVLVSVFLFSAGSFAGTNADSRAGNKYIKTAPAAPVFTSARRHEELAARRRRVADALEDNGVLVLFSAPSKLYANDVDYVYRQENNLFYLTGLRQNGLTLVISKKGGEVSETLFLPKRNPRFETWNGRMYSDQDAIGISGIQKIVDANQRDGFLDGLVSGTPKVYLLQGDKREYPAAYEFGDKLPDSRVRNALPIFARLRLVKSPYEIEIMQHSIDITSEALMRSMGMIGRAQWEYEVQAEVEYTFRRRNADFWGYPSIVGCGPNATTLHYVESQGRIRKNDLML